MDAELDIYIEIRFVGRAGVSYQVIDRTVSGVTWAIARVEQEELDAILKHFSEWPSIARDAIRYRFSQVEQRRLLNIEAARTGSIVLSAAAVGLAYWVVDKTLGETLKGAWKDSDLDRDLQQFLRKRVFKKRHRLTRYLHQQRFDMDSPIGTATLAQAVEAPIIRISVQASAVDDQLPKPSLVKSQEPRNDA